MLLFWPCAWGLTIAYDFSNSLNIYFLYLLFFFLGSIFMRSAGCIVNDIFDRNYDKKVFRTKNRPIASGKISVQLGLFYAATLCMFAFLVLINFNFTTILFALASMPLAFTYPIMKRFTYWPQLFLGITFNYGLILGWTSINTTFSIIPLIFYLGAIFWTLGYDTIYGFQDIKDDEIIGVKSTSIKFKKNPKFFIFLCYFFFYLSLITIGFLMTFSKFYFVFSLILFLQLFFFQVHSLDVDKPKDCIKRFKSNNILGFLVFINILIGKLL